MRRVAYPKTWNWADEAPARPLNQWALAPETTGFYELGFRMGQDFEPMYGGRAASLTLRSRLGRHFGGSHNETIRKNRDVLWYRLKVLGSFELACYVEAIQIAAMDYPWNKREEWAKHWILES